MKVFIVLLMASNISFALNYNISFESIKVSTLKRSVSVKVPTIVGGVEYQGEIRGTVSSVDSLVFQDNTIVQVKDHSAFVINKKIKDYIKSAYCNKAHSVNGKVKLTGATQVIFDRNIFGKHTFALVEFDYIVLAQDRNKKPVKKFGQLLCKN